MKGYCASTKGLGKRGLEDIGDREHKNLREGPKESVRGIFIPCQNMDYSITILPAPTSLIPMSFFYIPIRGYVYICSSFIHLINIY